MDLRTKLKKACESSLLPEMHKKHFLEMFESYAQVLEKHHIDVSLYAPIFFDFLKKIEENIKVPFAFSPFHKQIISPFNYYKFGIDFFSPLIDIPNSSVTGHSYLQEIADKLANGENVIFLANHQIEADPQAISVLLEDLHPNLAKKMIFVAGERVISDPLAIPFSLGRNLLCIYSKRYIDHPPELKAQKQIHNKKTLELMSQLLSEGGHSIYVAPSGGRDRADANGHVSVSKFDPQSIELFYLMTKKASKPTSFYPMALATYSLLPPPSTIQKELGEARTTNRGSIHLWVGPQISMDNFPGSAESDKKQRRELRANYIWEQVSTAYNQFPL
ncbi:MAG: 1-acyl-sn-glycerol-3-phosphate acyltransferase [Chlamydiota bacterium]